MTPPIGRASPDRSSLPLEHALEAPPETARSVERLVTSLTAAARRISADVTEELERALELGEAHPLTADEARRLLRKTVTRIRAWAATAGDQEVLAAVSEDVDELVERLVRHRHAGGAEGGARVAAEGASARPTPATGRAATLRLEAHNGVEPGPVLPTPMFHGTEVPMNSGFVRAKDIRLWDENKRLEIHLAQFRAEKGRGPTSDELLDIMLSRTPLPGVVDEAGRQEQFKIPALARSIATNGLRKPPILARDGRLLDGNRRIAAHDFIRHSDEFTSEQKRRAEWVFVWQLTEHATPEQEEAVVVALNFEPDHKEDWPEYVKAKEVYAEWRAMLDAEPRRPHARRQSDMKRELSKRFALGPDSHVVTRYIKMVEWATTFEEFHTQERNRDPYEVKHRTSHWFQYFDELSKGAGEGGVARALETNDTFRKLVFDLLYEGKFVNWRQIRDLKHVEPNQEAVDILKKARAESDVEEAQVQVKHAISVASLKKAENRSVGANTRIEVFTSWLRELPVSAFREQIYPQNLRRLLDALELVRGVAGQELASGEGDA